MTWKYILTSFISLIIGLVIGYFIWAGKTTIKIETVPEIVYKERIIEHTDTLYRTKVDSVITVKHIIDKDTLVIQDTIEIPIDHLVYNDSIKTGDFTVHINEEYSGYRPSIDRLELSVTGDVKVPENRNKVHSGASIVIGPTIDIGYDMLNHNFSPTVGFGITVGWGITIGK